MTARLRPLFLLFLTFIASRCLLDWTLGFRLDAQPLSQDYLQFLSWDRLHSACAESLWYLHAQPPLFNAALCLISKAPVKFTTLATLVWHSIAFAYFAGLIGLLDHADIPRRIGVPAALAFTLQPGFLAYESWLFYTLPVALLLLAFVYFTEASYRGRGTATLAAGLACLAGACLTHSLYHVGLYVLTMVLISLRPPPRARVLLAALPGAVAITLVSIKNLMVIGSLTMSTGLLGMQIANTSVASVTPEVRARLLSADENMLLNKPLYQAIDAYYAPEELTKMRRGISLLDDVYMDPVLRTRNFNHVGYLSLAAEYQRAGLHVLTHAPVAYFKYVAAKAAQQVFWPPGEHVPFADALKVGRARKAWRDLYNIVYLRLGKGPSVVLIAALVLHLIAGVTSLRRVIDRAPAARVNVPAVIILGLVVYTLSLTIFITAEELNRYRFYVDAFLYVNLVRWLYARFEKKMGKRRTA